MSFFKRFRKPENPDGQGVYQDQETGEIIGVKGTQDGPGTGGNAVFQDQETGEIIGVKGTQDGPGTGGNAVFQDQETGEIIGVRDAIGGLAHNLADASSLGPSNLLNGDTAATALGREMSIEVDIVADDDWDSPDQSLSQNEVVDF